MQEVGIWRRTPGVSENDVRPRNGIEPCTTRRLQFVGGIRLVVGGPAAVYKQPVAQGCSEFDLGRVVDLRVPYAERFLRPGARCRRSLMPAKLENPIEVGARL